MPTLTFLYTMLTFLIIPNKIKLIYKKFIWPTSQQVWHCYGCGIHLHGYATPVTANLDTYWLCHKSYPVPMQIETMYIFHVTSMIVLFSFEPIQLPFASWAALLLDVCKYTSYQSRKHLIHGRYSEVCCFLFQVWAPHSVNYILLQLSP